MQKIPLKTQYRSTFPDLKPGFINNHSRFFKTAIIILSDLITLSIALGIALALRFANQELPISILIEEIILFLIMALVIFLIASLYSIGISPVQELQRLTISITVVFLALAAFSLFLQKNSGDSQFFLVIGLILALVFVPLGREICRIIFLRHQAWCEPVVVIGYGPAGYEIAEYLVDNPQSGLYPVVVVDRRTTDRNITPRVPVIRASDILEHPEMVEELKSIHKAILVTNEINEDFVEMILEEQILHFKHLIVIPSSQQISSLWARPYMIGEMLGFEIGQNLLNPWHRSLKWIFDLLGILLFLPLLLLLSLIISLLIKFDSPGNILHRQTRVGAKNRLFKMLRFRTMYSNSEEILKAYLEANPDLAEIWNETHKLKDDPRITRFGRFLRKSRLVNLPQIINVLKGDMSLIGPSPILAEDVKYYGPIYPLYSGVLPGITGLAQISRFDDPARKSRLHLDEYYIRNWSIWLDYYIMFRTIIVSLRMLKPD